MISKTNEKRERTLNLQLYEQPDLTLLTQFRLQTLFSKSNNHLYPQISFNFLYPIF